MEENSPFDTKVGNMAADSPAATSEKQFTPGSMWAAITVSFVVACITFIGSVIALAVSYRTNPPSGPGEFFDVGLLIMVAICIITLLCLAFQIAGKADWRKELGVDAFPGWRTWLRVFPISALFIAVFAGSMYFFVGMQIRFISTFDPDAMLERLNSQIPQASPMSSASDLEMPPSFPDKEEMRTVMLYPLKYPFENGIWSGRFLLYLAALLLYALINELIFRGIGYAGYCRTGSSRRAVIIPGIINGVCFFPVGIVWSLLLGWIRVRGGSLYCCVAASMLGIVAAVAVMYFAFVQAMP